ncbi:polysaccharide pyruvyl transferase family protein [uncultured Roseibium sp.]|uniref:polysaccharide pyruvyl transferase family protein n=1 Tax=uncultured Roseibium sp. TaxID=1936171 RepID=UPI002622F535|nr:polysaccharide pyruvyl transferase family protein [uncultured Roseibium sp.]
MKQNIFLTTFPAHKSQNVGDALIADSTLRLIRARWPEFVPAIQFRGNLLDGFTKRSRHNVIAPGFSVSNGTSVEIYPLFSDLDRISKFFAFGCSYQHPIPEHDSFELPYDQETLVFLRSMAEQHGPFFCRDRLIEGRLKSQNIPSDFSGDLALFSEEKIGRDLGYKLDDLKIVVSLQHHTRYLEQSIILLKELKKEFPNSQIDISLHSVPKDLYKVITRRASELSIDCLHLYGDVNKLSAYEHYDLHVGYRLHAHICFLRNRKPSILLVEDARSFGFSNTSDLSHGCIQAWSAAERDADMDAPDRAVAFLRSQIDEKFAGYNKTLSFIDQIYHEKVAPYFDDMVEKLRTS